MMNIVAICLVLTTLATSVVWSPPTQEKINNKEDVIVKEGHRTVVVEFEKYDGNTKVSISPQEAPIHSRIDEKGSSDQDSSSLKERVSESAENVEEKLKDKAATPKELICDAFGKCKHRIAGAIGKTKEVVSDKAHETVERIVEVEEEARETAKDAFGKVKDSVSRKAHEASDKVKDAAVDKAHEAKEKVKDAAAQVSSKAKEAKENVKDAAMDKAHEAKEKVKDAAAQVSNKAKEAKENVKDAAMDKTHEAKEKAKDAAAQVSGKAKEEVKGGVKETYETAKTLSGDVGRNASLEVERTERKVKEGNGRVGEISKEVEEDIVRVKEKVNTKGIFQLGREALFGVLSYVLSSRSLASGTRILQLLGLAIAYGTSIWVSFISSYVLARALPRQQFAVLQSKIYPVYFKTMAYSVGMVLVGHLLRHGKGVSYGAGEMLQSVNLVASLLMLLVNLRFLEPRATKVMFERMKLEKEEGRGTESSSEALRVVDAITEPSGKASSAAAGCGQSSTPQERPKGGASQAETVRLNEAVRKLNTISSFLNVLTLMFLTGHLVHLGQLLQRAS